MHLELTCEQKSNYYLLDHPYVAAAVEPQRPMFFVRKSDGPKRGIAYVKMVWDDALHNRIGPNERYCYQAAENCPEQGFLRHLGKRFTPDPNDYSTWGFPITATGIVTGLTGGFGWLLDFSNSGTPKKIVFERLEIDPDSVLMLSIKYPAGTRFTITAQAELCNPDRGHICTEVFEPTDDVEEVRRLGNKYHVHPSGVLT